jgi:hypothetical protein
MPAFRWTVAQLCGTVQNFLGEVDNLQQGVENWVGEEKAKSYAFAFALTMNYGR